eukprot:4241174-Prymnesium_polylepis.1
MTLLFNCSGCPLWQHDGDADSVPASEEASLMVAFNLQVVGRLRKATESAETFVDRLELDNMWLPWHSSEAGVGDATIVLQVMFTANGKEQVISLIASPWLAYACALGARVKDSRGFATISALQPDDSVQVMYDSIETLLEPAGDDNQLMRRRGRQRAVIDPRPDTVARTGRFKYKPGTRIMLLQEGTWMDAHVVDYFGLRDGNRHRVRLGAARDTDEAVPTMVLDLNESNHGKLLFPSVTKYAESRA